MSRWIREAIEKRRKLVWSLKKKGYKHREIAEKVGMSEDTVKTDVAAMRKREASK